MAAGSALRSVARRSPVRTLTPLFVLWIAPASLGAATKGPSPVSLRTSEILVTSEAGAKLAPAANVAFRTTGPVDDSASGPVIAVDPAVRKQTVEGIGSSFTESSAFVLAHLEPAKRREVMERIYGADGANFTLARTHIGSCDFCVEGKYSYAAVADDRALAHFSIDVDSQGFDPAKYPGVKDPSFDLLPMIREAQAIKRAQGDAPPKIIASAWTAPPWMKDLEDWYVNASDENDWQGTGGSLKPEYRETYAKYLVRYLEEYRKAGVEIWRLTPVNEPYGNSGFWESMHFTPESQRGFIADVLGPALAASDHADTKLLVFDQNRDHLEEWATAILSDETAARYADGIAMHWYSSTYKVYEDVLRRVRERFPRHSLIHTEGCIDDLGKPAPGGIADPDGFQEEGWFDDDAFWWNRNATDWAYTASWAPNSEDHPMYTPVHRYARDLIVGLDHWLAGWVDWNVVLDRDGGPNHAGNFCGAPIMIDTATGHVHYTPIFHVMAQFSRTIRPGDVAVQTERTLAGLGSDDLHACATINGDGLLSVQVLNTTKGPITYRLRIGGEAATIESPANSVQTVRVALEAASGT